MMIISTITSIVAMIDCYFQTSQSRIIHSYGCRYRRYAAEGLLVRCKTPYSQSAVHNSYGDDHTLVLTAKAKCLLAFSVSEHSGT